MIRDHKFHRHFKVVDREDLKKHTGIIASPSYLDYKDIVEDYLRIVRLRFPHNIAAISNLQLHILQDIAIAEKTIRQFRNHIKTLKDDNKPDVEYFKREINLNRLFRSKLKDIGDALAWKFFDYDRSKIYLFANREEPGFLQEQGIFSEIVFWLSEYYSKGKLPILNSVTNCLRIGDVLTKDKSDNIDICEVKSSKKSGRSRKGKQLKAMDDLVRLLSDKRMLEGKIEKRIVQISINPQNYFNKAHTLISQAYNRGFGIIQLNDFSFASIFNYELIDDFEKVKPELDDLFRQYEKSWDDRNILLNNYMRYDFSPITAPYSIFPFKENVCADLMFGKLALSFHMNFSKFESFLRKKGIEVLLTPHEIIAKEPTLAREYLYILGKGNYNVKIPPMSLSPLLFEFRHPNTFVKEFFAVRDSLEYGETPHVLFVNEQEPKIWK